MGWQASVMLIIGMLVWMYWSAMLCWNKLAVVAVSTTTCYCLLKLSCLLVLWTDTLFNLKVFSLFINNVFSRSHFFFLVVTSLLLPMLLFEVDYSLCPSHLHVILVCHRLRVML